MTKFTMVLSLSALVLLGCSKKYSEPVTTAEPSRPTASEWAQFGGAVAAAPATPVGDLLAAADKFDGKTLVVEGQVTEVCQNKGCWMTLKHEGREMRVKFKDYGFFVPKDSAGKTARMEGVFQIEMVPVDEARHYLEDAGRHEEAAKITDPVASFTFMASGVQLR